MERASSYSRLVFVIDADRSSQSTICRWLEEAGYRTRRFDDTWSCVRAFESDTPELIILDHLTATRSVIDVARTIRRLEEAIPFIVISHDPNESTALASVREGAFDYQVKPVDRLHLLISVRHAAERRKLKREIEALESEIARRDAASPPEPGQPEEPDQLSMREIEKQAVAEALRFSKGNVSRAAKRLGLGRTTLYRKMTAYGLGDTRIMTDLNPRNRRSEPPAQPHGASESIVPPDL